MEVLPHNPCAFLYFRARNRPSQQLPSKELEAMDEDDPSSLERQSFLKVVQKNIDENLGNKEVSICINGSYEGI